MQITQAQSARDMVSSFTPFMPQAPDGEAGTPGKHNLVNPASPKSRTKPAANITRWELRTRSALNPTWTACKAFSTTSTTSSSRPYQGRKMDSSGSIFQPTCRASKSHRLIASGSARNSHMSKGKPPRMATFHSSKEAATNDTREIPPNPSCPTHGSAETLASDKSSSRRRFLRTAIGGTLAGSAMAAGMDLAAPGSASAQSQLTPDAALQELTDGNRRFTSGRITAHEQDLAILKQKTMEKQEPFAALLSCADSRVPV